MTLLAALALVCARPDASAAESGASAEQAWQFFRLGEYAMAVRTFESALAAAERGGDTYAECLFGLANVWNLRRPGEEPEMARAYYRRLMDELPGHRLAPWCELALVRMQHVVPVGQDPDLPAVRAGYRALIARHPDHLAAKEATLYLNATLVATLDPDLTREAVSNLTAYVASGTKEFLSPAWSVLAVCYNTLGQQEQRLHAEIESLKNVEIDPANPFNEFAWAYWNIATIAEFEVGDFDTARAYYRRLLEEYPTDQRVFPSREALARMDALEASLRAAAPPVEAAP